MANRRIDPRKQFSKKLAGRAEWFWFLYMVLILGLLAYRPEIGTVSVYLSLICTVVMIVSALCYTDNSKYEKGLLAAADMAKLKFSWKHKGTEMVTIENVVEEETTEETKEEGDNG